MSQEDNLSTVYKETMLESGFMTGIRENRIDRQGFERLCNAIAALTGDFKDEKMIDKLLIACLFEVPWEIENTVAHYRKRDQSLGKEVSEMADRIRALISDLVWTGLEEHYQG